MNADAGRRVRKKTLFGRTAGIGLFGKWHWKHPRKRKWLRIHFLAVWAEEAVTQKEMRERNQETEEEGRTRVFFSWKREGEKT